MLGLVMRLRVNESLDRRCRELGLAVRGKELGPVVLGQRCLRVSEPEAV